jgi:hypothetical protein
VQAPGFLNFNGIDPSALDIASDEAFEYPGFGSYDFMTANIFERPTMAKNDASTPYSVQDFRIINPTAETTRSDSAELTCVITQNGDPSALKKRKTSAIPESMEPAKDIKVFDRFANLNLLFKYTQDPTMIQMLNIAEDTGFTPEFVVSS